MNAVTLDTVTQQIETLGETALRIKAERDEMAEALRKIAGMEVVDAGSRALRDMAADALAKAGL